MSMFTRTMYSRCQRKVRYATKAEAKDAIRSMIRCGQTVPGIMRVYACDSCAGGWHVGAIRCSQKDIRPTRTIITSGCVELVGQGR